MLAVTNDKWIEIDVDAVANNLQAIRNVLDKRVRLIAVVKANAYGHGACEIARLLSQQGVEYFAVSFLYEALQLRKSGIKSSIMLFSPIYSEAQAVEALENNITLTIASVSDAVLVSSACDRLNRQVTVHLKFDSGLGRFGMDGEEVASAWNTMKENSHIYIEGIYTHMARAASTSYTIQQFKQFKQVVEKLQQAGAHIPIKHCANSAVLLKYPEMHMDAVRVGTLLSGQAPVGVLGDKLKLIDPYKFKSRIISLRQLKAGSRLGYYSTYRLRRDALVAVIPVGFNDGLALEVANKPAGFVDMLKHVVKMILSYLNMPRFNMHVVIKGQQYPVRGKVFMQMALIELPLETDVIIGDEVEVPIRKTIASSALMRVYTKDGIPVKIGQDERTTYFPGEG